MEISKLVAQLASLPDGPAAVDRLVACGPGAVPPLRDALLRGRIESVWQPRAWMVEALARLGAKQPLMEYLEAAREVPDPVLRQGEDAVESAAARALASWRSDDVFAVLLRHAGRRPSIGAVEALGRFGRPAVVPVLIRALEDGACRRAAEAALEAVGPPAIPALVEAALDPRPRRGDEAPSSLNRRRSAVALLVSAALSPEDWGRLREVLFEPDPALVVGAARLAAANGDAVDHDVALSQLLDVLPSADAFLQIEAEDCLVSLHARERIGAEIRARLAAPEEQRIHDRTLRTLLRARKRIEAGTPRP